MAKDISLLVDGLSPPFPDPVAITGLEFDHATFRPITKRTVAYIVVGLAFDEDDRVLMMQEAKSSCRGSWYLPAGRLELGETLIEGVQREVLEETGLSYEPETILCVEMQGAVWQRVTFIGRAPTGRLKPTADKESLDARWMKWPDLKSKPIRCQDIFSLIELGIEYRRKKEVKFAPVFPLLTPVANLFLRLVVYREEPREGALDPDVLIIADDNDRLPALGMDAFTPRMQRFVTKAVKHLTNDGLKELSCRGLLAIEHCGKTIRDAKGLDGSSHTLMLKVVVAEEAGCAEGFRWTILDEELRKAIKGRQISPAVIFL